MFLNAKQCFSIYQQKSKEEKVKTFHFNYVLAQKPWLPSQQRVKKGGFEGVSLGLFTPNFHLSLTWTVLPVIYREMLNYVEQANL